MADVVELELTRGQSAPRDARRLIDSSFGSTLQRAELESAKLCISELVTNALVHGRGTIRLRLALDEDKLLVEVIDEGAGFEREVRVEDFEQLGGWGLTIVDAVSSRWGVHDGTTHVWFELERPGPRIGAEKNPLGEDSPTG
ncbi:MAG: ATP-binding protein [Solirubrobacterales bacterium]|nr:ATP-binding protein [Solirubrobacterales bacterium]